MRHLLNPGHALNPSCPNWSALNDSCPRLASEVRRNNPYGSCRLCNPLSGSLLERIEDNNPTTLDWVLALNRNSPY